MAEKKSDLQKIREKRQEKIFHAPADWMEADADVLRRAIAAAGFKGGALRFGYTRDGGAYAIGVYGSGDPFTEYVKPGDDINAYLQTLIDDFGAL